MAKPLFFFFVFVFVFSSIVFFLHSAVSFPSPSDAYTELTEYGFPVGLLPGNVHTYTLNRTSGKFIIQLTGDCKVTLPPDNYLAAYSNQITGKIVENRIVELDGIRVRAFFRWWGITGIRSNGEHLVFDVGMTSAKYPSKNFHKSPACEGEHSSS